MTSISDSIDISLSGVHRSWNAFRASKHLSRAIITFEYNLEDNLAQLARDLQNNQYNHGVYRRMIVNDSKRRTIAVAPVRDRVVHRLLYDYFVPRTDHRFDYDVWSCRAGKGLQPGVRRAQVLLQKHPNAYIWRSDVTKFFDSVDHKILNEMVRRFIVDERALDLTGRIIKSFHTQPGRGIAIGNLTSQIFSNVYLHEFDWFVRHTIKPLGYVRYGDDFIICMPDYLQANTAKDLGTQFLASRLGLAVNSNNTTIVRARDGLLFLGVKLYGSGTRIQARTWQRLETRISPSNAASYWGFAQTFGSHEQKTAFRWLDTKR